MVVSESKVALFCVDDLPASQAARRKGRREVSAGRDKGKDTGKERGQETGQGKGKEAGKEKGKAPKPVLREPLDNEEEQVVGYRFIDPPLHQRGLYPVDERDEHLPEVALRFAPKGYRMDVEEGVADYNMHQVGIEPPARAIVPPFDFYGMDPHGRTGSRSGHLHTFQGGVGSYPANASGAYAHPPYTGTRSGLSLQEEAALRTANHRALGAQPMQRNQGTLVAPTYANQHRGSGRSSELARLLQEEQETPVEYYRQREWREGMAGPSNEVFIDPREQREELVRRQREDAKKQQRRYRD